LRGGDVIAGAGVRTQQNNKREEQSNDAHGIGSHAMAIFKPISSREVVQTGRAVFPRDCKCCLMLVCARALVTPPLLARKKAG
jgi:hypothetical protein